MDLFSSLSATFLTPMVLAFLLGIIASVLKSDLKFSDGLYLGLTIYLLFAIGLKGGVKLSKSSIIEVYPIFLVAIAFCIAIPIWCFYILKNLLKIDGINASAIAAHYGCVSAVTFSSAIIYLETLKVSFEGFMPALLAIMEIPAIIIALFLAAKYNTQQTTSMRRILHELLTGKGTILLMGGILIGLLSGETGFTKIAPLFDAPFSGVLTLFLLDAGIVAGRKLKDTLSAGIYLFLFAIIMPVLHAILGLFASHAIGLSLGGATIFATLCASASYIAAPAAVRMALPTANPSYYLSMSLAITFPFNVIFGIPLYYKIAGMVYGV
ncbi:sodium-dependent bicarbonate transport family permease [Leptospira sp. GIMC2001]|uniref:sodium-dependent bicarbonate transport family permease n=1 Tax=Leptospira sp. GIMC2001 TaxID=1513297 RepID=UPI00234AC458|nr:sodium-dependent bicarbonate transport family permease [Leptospira sp. GIMC2001]WCL50846.1 sodium-dependent bicarbonate transport family permease [Leptospira sp. GIMC2001]